MRVPTFIVAEAGVNHNGSAERALALVDAAAAAGADAVKFQTFRSELVISRGAAKAAYQEAATGAGESQLDMVRKLELDEETHFRLRDRAAACGLEFLSTPFDAPSADFLIGRMHLSRIKIPSGEITNAPLLLRIAASGLPVLMSTGMATLGEVEAALGVLAFGYLGDAAHPPGPAAFAAAFAAEAGQAALRARVTLLHCTTEYPAPVEDTNLRAMDTLRRAFDLPVGYSDHTDGIAIAVAAAARGATCIEKHFTLDRDLPGPDHRASIEPGTLAAMVRSVRAVESAMGDGVKRPRPSELANRMVARKSLVAARALARGEIFSADNVAAKRPGGGLAPMLWWAVLGRAAARDYAADEPLDGGEAGGVA